MKNFRTYKNSFLAILLICLLLLTSCGKIVEIENPKNNSTTLSSSTASSAVTTITQKNDDTIVGHPTLYKITKSGEEGTIYLFGSIHVARESEILVPNEVTDILNECKTLAVESDIIALESDITLSAEYTYAMMYRDGTNIKDHISEELYKKLSAFINTAGYGSSLSYLQMFDAMFWLSLIEQELMVSFGCDIEAGVDRTLLKLAKDKKYEIIELEDPIDTVKTLYGPDNDDYAVISLNSIFMDDDYEETLTSLEEELNALIDSWKSGKTEDSLEDDFSDLTDDEIEIVKAYNKKILGDRNVNMIEKAEKMISDGQNVLYVVGSAHIVGENGIVEVLKSKGYSIELIETTLP